jgi:hypothetical protein
MKTFVAISMPNMKNREENIISEKMMGWPSVHELIHQFEAPSQGPGRKSRE